MTQVSDEHIGSVVGPDNKDYRLLFRVDDGVGVAVLLGPAPPPLNGQFPVRMGELVLVHSEPADNIDQARGVLRMWLWKNGWLHLKHNFGVHAYAYLVRCDNGCEERIEVNDLSSKRDDGTTSLLFDAVWKESAHSDLGMLAGTPDTAARDAARYWIARSLRCGIADVRLVSGPPSSF